MSILNPDHLFEQVERLIAPPQAGPPRQVDLRRAISSAYYGVFHFVLTAVADNFIGAVHRATNRYALMYRRIDHRSFRDLCEESRKPTLSARFRSVVPGSALAQPIRSFASQALELQERRHVADYDPSQRFRTFDAKTAIAAARSAKQQFEFAPEDHRQAFLTLLLCPPRWALRHLR